MEGRNYNHAEAFCLMQYATEDGSERELIWNSRDGVTPMYITSRSGREMRHVNWRDDRCLPDYEPPDGSRLFVDMTRQHALEIARRILARHGVTDIEEIHQLAEGYLDPPGNPMIVEAGRYRTERLIEASSLGTPEARAIRAQAPPEAVDRILNDVRLRSGFDNATDPMPAEDNATTDGNATIDWAEVGRLKDAEMRRWERSGHPGSKPKVAHTELAAARKRERQARKVGRR